MQYFNKELNHAPSGYYDARTEQMQKHRFVGRKAFIDGKVYECIRAEDDLAVFRVTEASELIVSGYDAVSNIRWCKASQK